MSDDPDYAHHPPAAAPRPKRFNLAAAHGRAMRQAREGKGEGRIVSGFHADSMEAGEAARGAGQPRSSNPHPPGSLKHESWDAGFGDE